MMLFYLFCFYFTVFVQFAYNRYNKLQCKYTILILFCVIFFQRQDDLTLQLDENLIILYKVIFFSYICRLAYCVAATTMRCVLAPYGAM